MIGWVFDNTALASVVVLTCTESSALRSLCKGAEELLKENITTGAVRGMCRRVRGCRVRYDLKVHDRKKRGC